jgi:hypothetical protein
MSKWDKKIQKAERFFEKAQTHGRLVYKRYKDDRGDEINSLKRVNLFYANVNTIKESLFNSLPKPDVSRLHKGDFEDDVARVAAQILQRALTYEIQCAKSFEQSVKYAILDRLVPGIGQVWLRYEDPEKIFIDILYWENFIYEPARCWDLVTWVGRIHDLEKDEFKKLYGDEAFEAASQAKNDNDITPKQITDGKFRVYEIWSKKDKKVYHVVKGAEKPVKTLPDPYGLRDFFPCPEPLLANPTTSAYLPITDYHLSQDQYNELDTLYARMSLIVQAIKVAGCYDSASTEIANMLQGQENKLIPCDNWAMFAEKGGAKGMIDWYPVEQIVTVLQALVAQYDAVKQTLYEVSGMSDIMRGATNQYETASAQEIKAQFASVRMNGYQRDVSHFVRDILNLMAHLICKLYSDQKLQQICGTFTETDQAFLPEAVKVLRDSVLRMYKVDVEADSLTQSDWALEKGQRMELTGYISQFLTSAVPAIQEMPELAPLLVGMLKFTVAGYKGSAEIEGLLDQQMAAILEKAANPEPPKPTPEEQKMELEQKKMEQEGEMKKAEMEGTAALKQQESNQKMELEQQQAAADMAVQNKKIESEAALKEMEMQHKRELHAMDIQMKEMEMDFKRQELQMKLDGQQIAGELKTQQMHEQAEIKNDQAKRQGTNGKGSSTEST